MFDAASVCTNETMGKIKGFNKLHSFKVGLNNQGEPAFWYKSWSRHRIWKPYLKDAEGEYCSCKQATQ